MIPECISSKARCIIRALLRRDPKERITSDDILYHPWFKNREILDLTSDCHSTEDQIVPQLECRITAYSKT